MPAPRTDTPAETPLLSLVLGYGPALLLPVLGVLAWLGVPWALAAGRIWGAAILLFLAGVARGLSFFTEGGPRPLQLAAMSLRFGIGLVALAVWLPGAFALLILGYASVPLTDAHAARHGQAPRYFAVLRPPQMGIALLGLAILLLRSLGWV
jgi:hypothetical protein